MKSKICLVAVLTFLFPATAVLAAPTTATFISEGNTALEAGNWTQASVDFLAAGNQSPTNPQAQTLAAISELLAVEQSSTLQTLLGRMGFDLDNSNMPPVLTPDPDGPANNANASEVQSFEVNTLLPLVQDADKRLAAAIGNLTANATVGLTADQTGSMAVNLDKGDLLTLRMFAQAYICGALLSKSVNLNVFIGDMIDLQQDGNLDIEHVRQLYPQLFGRPAGTAQAADLTAAKAAFTLVSSLYASAKAIILPAKGVRADQNPLFFVDPTNSNDVQTANNFATGLALAVKGLAGPVVLPISSDSTFTSQFGQVKINLAPIFAGTVDPVQIFPATLNNLPVISSLPDPTLGGVLASGTTAFWQRIALHSNVQPKAPAIWVDPSLYLQNDEDPTQFFPYNSTITTDGFLQISFAVLGSKPYTVTWYKDGVEFDPTTNPNFFSGILSNQVFLTDYSPTTDDSGNYSVKVTNRFGSVQESANITVVEGDDNTGEKAAVTPGAPIIQWVSPATSTLNLPVGANTQLQINVTSNLTTTVAWFLNGQAIQGSSQTISGGDFNGGPIFISNSIDHATSLDAGVYSVTATNTKGKTTANLTVTVPAGPSITTQPTAQSGSANSTVQLSAVSNGGAGAFYAWTLNNVVLTNGANYSGVNTPNLTISNLSGNLAGTYRLLVVTPNGVTSTTGAAVAVALVAPKITAQPGPVTAVAGVGATATFTVNASGSTPLTYQWTLGGKNIAGATSSQLNVANVTTASAGKYAVVVKNSKGSVTSTAVALTVLVEPGFVTNLPATATVKAGKTVTFTVKANGTTPFTYQWQRNGSNLPNGGQYSGVTTASLKVTGVTSANNGNTFRVDVFNSATALLGNVPAASVVVSLTVD
jgi:hypothetical protein